MIIQPYLNFAGRCEEAINFHRKAVGAEVEMMMRFKDAPPMGDGPGPRPAPEMVLVPTDGAPS